MIQRCFEARSVTMLLEYGACHSLRHESGEYLGQSGFAARF